MKWSKAKDIQTRINKILERIDMEYIEPKRLFCFRSNGSKANARARIWSLPTVWQQALNTSPGYVIEVISEKFDHLNYNDQTRILIHELLHIPKTFSGALRPHHGRHVRVDDKHVDKLYKKYKSSE